LPNIVGVRLLPYHLARSKYEAVGRSDTMPEVAPPDAAAMARATVILQGYGLVVLA
jgi:pyruvate-formate lyase-activating enzyme